MSVCGRYYIAEDDLSDELSRMIDELNRKKTPEGLKTSGEIFPSDIVPVLANSRKQDVQPFAMRWGYAFPNGRPIINARSETAAQKPMVQGRHAPAALRHPLPATTSSGRGTALRGRNMPFALHALIRCIWQASTIWRIMTA